MSEQHRTAVFVGDRRIRIAKCSCGWEGTPHASSFAAQVEGEQHRKQAAAAAPRDEGWGTEG